METSSGHSVCPEPEARTAERHAPLEYDWHDVEPHRWRVAVALALASIIVIAPIVAGFVGDEPFTRQMELAREALRSVALLAATSARRCPQRAPVASRAARSATRAGCATAT
jgi:hypothetical protein